MTSLNHCCAPGLGPQLPLRGPPLGLLEDGASFLISAGIFFYLVPYTCLLKIMLVLRVRCGWEGILNLRIYRDPQWTQIQ